MNSEIVFSLNKSDIQTVAFQEIERKLSDDEIEKIRDLIAEKINWYDAIADVVNENFVNISPEL